MKSFNVLIPPLPSPIQQKLVRWLVSILRAGTQSPSALTGAWGGQLGQHSIQNQAGS